MKKAIFPYLPVEKILEALLKAPGQEVETGKLESPESSSALAVNTFGLFLDEPEIMPAIPGTAGIGWPALAVQIEKGVRFPWAGGRQRLRTRRLGSWRTVFVKR